MAPNPSPLSILELATKADAWADALTSDRRSVLDSLRAKRDKLSKQQAKRGPLHQCLSWDSLASRRLRAFEAAIALLEAAESGP